MDVERVRTDFPIYKEGGLHYLDSAATSLKPYVVLEKMLQYYREYSANIHRSPHKLGERATEEYEKAREKIAGFINAKPEEVVFTKNATESLNLAAYSLRKTAKKVAVSIGEHHSNFLPWQQLYDIDALAIDREGFIKPPTNKVDIFAFQHTSNVTGAIQDVEELVKIARDMDSLSIMDASQGVPHTKIDVKKLGVDIMAFTGHKMLGPTGVGALYIREGVEERMEPFLYGGEMIESVSVEKSIFADMPHRYEAGTPPIAEVIGLGEAVSYLKALSMDEVREHEKALTSYTLERFREEGINYIGPENTDRRAGIVSFTMDSIHPHDIASLLSDGCNVSIRAGYHCAQPLHNALGIAASARASLYIYNDKEDIDKLIEGLVSIRRRFNG
ncbi:MAG: cysteine desulfurase [Methanobacteriota archaeon]|nr:MAG: cysteine desulfurase [Euryarchaeota archaeon]